MRVQLITHSYLPEYTPPRRRWEAFVSELRRAGIQVDVIAPVADPRWLSTPEDHQAARTRWGPSGERIVRVPGLAALTGSRDGRFYASVIQSLASIPTSWTIERPDVLVVTIPALPLVVPARVIAATQRVPLIVEMRDAWPDLAFDSGVKAGLLSKVLAWLVTDAQRSAAAVVTVTRGFGERLIERGIERVVHIGNGVARVSRWDNLKSRDRRTGELNVLYLGNHGESQGLDTLIEAAALARQRNVGIKVHFVGDGTQVSYLRTVNHRFGNPVTMLGPVSPQAVAAHYSWADTCVVSLRSDWKSFDWTVPSKTYELISTGKHLTGIVTGEAAGILTDYGNSIVVADDPEEIAESWVQLAQDSTSTPMTDHGEDWLQRNAELSILGRRMVNLVQSVKERHDLAHHDQGNRMKSTSNRPSWIGQLRRNARLTSTTVADHLNDDPVLLALQISRRLPQRLRGPLSKVGTMVHGGGLDLVRGVSLGAAGRSVELKRMALDAVEKRSPDRHLVTWADLMINDGDVVTAKWILDRTRPGTRGRNEALARLEWHQGNMSAAIALLEGTRATKHRRRLSSELRSYQGAAPELKPVAGYLPNQDKVLHVLTNSLPHTGSGYAQRSHSILASLKDRGWNVSAVTRIGWPVQTGSLGASRVDVVDGITYRRLLPLQLATGFDSRLQQQAEMLLEVVLEERPSVLHTTTHWTNALVTQAVAVSVGIPWVYEVRGQLADTWASTRDAQALNSERYRLFVEREDVVSRAADAVVTLGDNMRARLMGVGVSATKIEVCPNAVGGVFIEPPLTKAEARQELGLDERLEYIGTVSSIVPYEGLDTVLRAAAQLAERRPNLRVLYVGDGTDLPRLRELAAELGISDRLLTPGRVDRTKTNLYHQALDVFVVPRRDTPVTRSVTPMKPVEASASSRPVLASNLPALEELVVDGETGMLVAPENPGEWAGAIEALLESPELAESLGSRGREWVLAERTWAANAEKYERIYKKLISENTR
ncbi:glycosyltransferase family 4 protein [Citricoccus muralis]|uniref:Glycosyltransferase family 4 protein n=1 Tax=Citricoccus muralis TaxID=169134 RepID=A0ABY8H9C1_9MICC|nr:glycosyltransferase family 4 protein [Citricoccus muralis]WFP17754.1 glycosyltransferase family 4 protein [Citricoccus muralis]